VRAAGAPLADAMTATLLLVRNAETDWNVLDFHLGWVDVPLNAAGRRQSQHGGSLLSTQGLLPSVVHTSLLRRAIDTANLALAASERHWIPVRRSWRLNERHYGALQGRDEETGVAQFGAQAIARWRNSPFIAPPPLPDDDEHAQVRDPRYADLGPDAPRTESIADVRARMLPYFLDAIVPDLRAGTVLVAAHGNPLRALIAHLEGASLDAVKALAMPGGIALRYELDEASLRPVQPARYVDGTAEGTALELG
jgi:2,3-bisphosphoglycerate-dependent phosphoglycerate mutase